VQVLGEALALAEPGGFIRLFLDEGQPMAQLLTEASVHGMMPDYTGKLLAEFEEETKDERRMTEETDVRRSSTPEEITVDDRRTMDDGRQTTDEAAVVRPSSLVEPLSQRELEILQLIAEGLSNREISERLFLALDTVKGHNQKIYGKLQVQRRTEAVARARELGLV
jgi:LuxR family maltose regulon positive regulatory protein